MATALNYSAPIPPVNMESSNMKAEWQRWKESFSMFSIASELDKKDDKAQRATLLHLAGPSVQSVLANLPGEKTSTADVTKVLDDFLHQKVISGPNDTASSVVFSNHTKQRINSYQICVNSLQIAVSAITCMSSLLVKFSKSATTRKSEKNCSVKVILSL